MTIAPVFLLGWENGIAEGNALGSGTIPAVSAVKAHTGSYSLLFSASGQGPYGRSLATGLTNLQFGAYVNHLGYNIGAGANTSILRLTNSVGIIYSVGVQGGTVLTLYRGSTQLATADLAPLSPTNTWLDISAAFKTSTFFDFYVNGVLAIAYPNTNNDIDSQAITSVYVGGRLNGSSNGSANFYYDDVRLSDATGESSRPMSSRRAYWSQVNGNGQINEFTGSDGDSTDNYLLVDDPIGSNDGDTTYVKATTDALQEQYTFVDVSLPADWLPARVWPTVIAKKTDAGLDTTVKLGLWKDSSMLESAELPLSTTYDLVQYPFSELPDSSDLTEANINDDMEFRAVSSGDYV